MERIERKYAIIYIDREGETLKQKEVDTVERDIDDFTLNSMVTDYYSNPGFLQWNFYLIISKEAVRKTPLIDRHGNELVAQTTIDKINFIESNDTYTRKYVIDNDSIDSFIENLFPVMNRDLKVQARLLKGTNYKETIELADKACKEEKAPILKGWYRDESLLYSISRMDEIRARLIKNPDMNIIFTTHISNEFNLAEKKFKIFSKEGIEIIKKDAEEKRKKNLKYIIRVEDDFHIIDLNSDIVGGYYFDRLNKTIRKGFDMSQHSLGKDAKIIASSKIFEKADEDDNIPLLIYKDAFESYILKKCCNNDYLKKLSEIHCPINNQVIDSGVTQAEVEEARRKFMIKHATKDFIETNVILEELMECETAGMTKNNE